VVENPQPEKPRTSPWKITWCGGTALLAALFLGWLMKLPLVTLIRSVQNKEIYPTASAPDSGASPTSWRKHFCDPCVLLPSVLTTQLGLFIIAWWNIRRASRKGQALPPLHDGPPMKAILAGLGGALVLLAVAMLNGFFIRQVLGCCPPRPWKAVQEFVPWARVSILLFAVVVSPLAEEVFFRGYLFAKFKREGHIFFGMVTSALLFAALHVHNPYSMGAFFGFGLVLALLYHRTGSLLSSITAHAANNGLVFLWLLAGA
jgi:membrane protease YdiL (CAAX protease family)